MHTMYAIVHETERHYEFATKRVRTCTEITYILLASFNCVCVCARAQRMHVTGTTIQGKLRFSHRWKKSLTNSSIQVHVCIL